MKSKIENTKQLVLKSYVDNKTYSFNVSDILAITPGEKEIVIMTKGGKSTAIKAYIPEEDTVQIYYETFLSPEDFVPFEKFEKREYCFVILSDYAIVNVDEITSVKKTIDKKELEIAFGRRKIKTQKNVDFIEDYLNEVKELRSNARADESAELQ